MVQSSQWSLGCMMGNARWWVVWRMPVVLPSRISISTTVVALLPKIIMLVITETSSAIIMKKYLLRPSFARSMYPVGSSCPMYPTSWLPTTHPKLTAAFWVPWTWFSSLPREVAWWACVRPKELAPDHYLRIMLEAEGEAEDELDMKKSRKGDLFLAWYNNWHLFCIFLLKKSCL